MQQRETPLLQWGRRMPCPSLPPPLPCLAPVGKWTARERLGNCSVMSFPGQCHGTPGQRPSPGSPRFFWSLWQLVVFDACFCRDEGSEAESRRAAENMRSWQIAGHQHHALPQKKENGDSKEEWRQGEGWEDLLHLHAAWAGPGLSRLGSENQKQRVGGRGTGVLINTRLKR